MESSLVDSGGLDQGPQHGGVGNGTLISSMAILSASTGRQPAFKAVLLLDLLHALGRIDNHGSFGFQPGGNIDDIQQGRDPRTTTMSG